MNASKTPARRRQVDRSAASTAAMLDAAIELIIEQGADVSMKAIGERAGFSHGLVLARFGSKANLNEAVAEEAQRRFTETIDATGGETGGLAKLHRTIDVYLRSLIKVSQAFYILLGASLSPNAQLRSAFAHADKAFRRYMSSHLQEAQAQGELDASVDAQAMATLLVGMLRGVAMQHCISPGAFEIDAVAAEAHAFVTRLSKPPNRSGRPGRAPMDTPEPARSRRGLKTSSAA